MTEQKIYTLEELSIALLEGEVDYDVIVEHKDEKYKFRFQNYEYLCDDYGSNKVQELFYNFDVMKRNGAFIDWDGEPVKPAIDASRTSNPHYSSILEFIYKMVCSCGGDGDAYWLLKHADLHDVVELINEYDPSEGRWEVIDKGNYFLWGTEQEWAVITEDKEKFNEAEDWVITKLIH